jgi:hypothetical protein
MALAKTVVAILIIIALVVVAVYICGQFTQTRPLYDKAAALATTAKDFVVKNWALVAGSLGTIVTIGGVAVSKLSAAKTQLSAVSKTASDEAAKVKELEAKITAYTQTSTDQTAKYEAEIAALEAKVPDVSTYTTQIKTLEGQLQATQTQNSDFVKGLMQASNGALVTNGVDGKIYSVLKLPPEKQVL